MLRSDLLRGLLAAVLAAVLAGTACGRQPAPEAERDSQTLVPVAAEPVTTGSLRAVIRASGVVVPAAGAEFLVVAPEPARLVEVMKKEGDTVASGEIVARFELPGAAQELARQRADLARAESDLENARVAHARVRDFADRGMVPRRDLDVAERELAEAQAAAGRVQAAHADAEEAAARAVARAPFAGVVLKRFHDPGDLVQGAATDPVLRIVDPRRVDVYVTVPKADIARVLPGASARMPNPDGGAPVRLTVVSRGAPSPASAAAPAGDMVPVVLSFVEPVTVPVDTRVDVEIDAEERTGVVLLPPEVLVRDGGQTAVMVAAGDRAERRPVTLGISDEGRVEITSGLKPGELVITRGHVGLTDGAAISVAR